MAQKPGGVRPYVACLPKNISDGHLELESSFTTKNTNKTLNLSSQFELFELFFIGYLELSHSHLLNNICTLYIYKRIFLIDPYLSNTWLKLR